MISFVYFVRIIFNLVFMYAGVFMVTLKFTLLYTTFVKKGAVETLFYYNLLYHSQVLRSMHWNDFQRQRLLIGYCILLLKDIFLDFCPLIICFSWFGLRSRNFSITLTTSISVRLNLSLSLSPMFNDYSLYFRFGSDD